jgi:hypothetical protein
LEGFIIMVVIALVTRLFAGNAEEKKQKQAPKTEKAPAPMPPFSNNKPSTTYFEPPVREQRTSSPKVETRSLEDFTQEVFGQLQQKVEQKVERPTVQEPVAVPTPTTARGESSRPIFQNRAELGAGRSIIQQAKKQKANVKIPKTRQELVQAVMMAEVLGAPKAKQKRI